MGEPSQNCSTAHNVRREWQEENDAYLILNVTTISVDSGASSTKIISPFNLIF